MPEELQQPELGARLRAQREALGLTRAHLAACVGVSSSSVERLEAGKDVRLSSYLPVVHYLSRQRPQPWQLAQLIALLSDEQCRTLRELFSDQESPDAR